MSDEEISARNSRIIETPYKSLFRRLVKIDHYVPAENYVEFQLETNRIHQIESFKYYVVTQNIGNFVHAAF